MEIRTRGDSIRLNAVAVEKNSRGRELSTNVHLLLNSGHTRGKQVTHEHLSFRCDTGRHPKFSINWGARHTNHLRRCELLYTA
jgi:hypothetical protein